MPFRNRLLDASTNMVLDVEDEPASGFDDTGDFFPCGLVEIAVVFPPMEDRCATWAGIMAQLVLVGVALGGVLGVVVIRHAITKAGRGRNG